MFEGFDEMSGGEVMSKEERKKMEEKKFVKRKMELKVRRGRGKYILMEIGGKKLLCSVVEKWYWE